MLNATNLRCEYTKELLGTDELHPRFSWIIQADGKNILQKAFHFQVAIDSDFNNLTMDTKWVNSRQSINIEYTGKGLLPSTRYFFRVQIRDDRGEESSWSNSEWLESGLLNSKNWEADFISPKGENNPNGSQGWILKKEFTLVNKVASARIYATALGVYDLIMNGEKVGINTLAPGWTNYKKRLLYQTYDVTALLVPGLNSLEGGLGCGWFKGDLASWLGKRNYYGRRNALSLQLLIQYGNGREQWIRTNESWVSLPSPVIYSEIYHGETYDARLETSGLSGVNQWRGVEILEQDTSIICAQDGPLITPQEVLPVLELIRTPSGEQVLDFGQNLTGRVRFKVRGNPGDRVVLKHAEVLDSKGEFYTENLRSAKQRIEYILKGGVSVEIYEPHFTFQGFRYVLLEEYPGIPNPKDFQAVVLHSEMEDIGFFECSSNLVNRLHHNILWGMKGNFLDIPSDCPQRDERLGWTGDAQVFISTASYLKQTAPFFRKWLRDLQTEQLINGGIPHVIPNVLEDAHDDILKGTHSATGWADAAVICPWEIYKAFGNQRILEEQYESMKAWISYIQRKAEDGVLWNSGFHFGDWVALDAKEGSYFGATPIDLTATAFYANSVDIMYKAAAILGRSDDSEKYRQLYKNIKTAFQNEFFTPAGSLTASTQTSHILALMFNLVPKPHRKLTVDALVKLIEENGNHLTTGFLGTPYICRVLSDNGRNDIAYRLLLQEDYPSWLYSVKNGATTIWEHWDGIKPDGSMWSPQMNSFNHYAYGAVGHWLYETVGGIQHLPGDSGYSNILLKPQPDRSLSYAETKYKTPYGEVSLKWEIKDGMMSIIVKIPHNSKAVLYLPSSKEQGKEEEPLELGSGEYTYNYTY